MHTKYREYCKIPGIQQIVTIVSYETNENCDNVIHLRYPDYVLCRTGIIGLRAYPTAPSVAPLVHPPPQQHGLRRVRYAVIVTLGQTLQYPLSNPRVVGFRYCSTTAVSIAAPTTPAIDTLTHTLTRCADENAFRRDTNIENVSPAMGGGRCNQQFQFLL